MISSKVQVPGLNKKPIQIFYCMKMYLIVLVLATAVLSIDARKFNNPLITGVSDPSVIKIDGTYYLIGTAPDASNGVFPIYTSMDLDQWRPAGVAINPGNIPSWVDKNTFTSPVIHKFGSKYLLYYGAKDITTHKYIAAVAKASNPLGPYIPVDKTLMYLPDDKVFHPAVMEDGGLENAMLLWATKEHFISARPLNKDGQSFHSDTTSLILKPSAKWEIGRLFSPWYMKSGSFHYLMYDNGRGSVGVARSVEALGYYKKPYNPIIVADNTYRRIGQVTTAKDTNGNDDVIFVGAILNGNPVVLGASLTWNNDWPQVGEF